MTRFGYVGPESCGFTLDIHVSSIQTLTPTNTHTDTRMHIPTLMCIRKLLLSVAWVRNVLNFKTAASLLQYDMLF